MKNLDAEFEALMRDGVRCGNQGEGSGGFLMRPLVKLPLRERYTPRSQRDAMAALVRLITEDNLAAAIVRAR